ncbi:MAG TPA: GNAT family N-acetyltransferase [candidate division Zixibacteria bacterium]|nr:GNAT family N-acetyltransferase [candidate division Zixibacteria bacterium]MDD4918829.1 GNAT family N-acetyltransferase [candidate division Zixibacteria bacterium]MDM7973634.1 GNAT family N-acetyltransferase [candidate division Zixibacteria bacterium]HOD66502.1 GNAT family N-acetyltransferase [candidate division Zixibacteria bacterium]HOZ07138.1 GNAT family N-acetyltransferase [candidate division Zixibacteria bacterium]
MITTAPDSITKIPSLQGALINLRPVRPADIRAIARYANDPSVARWVPNLPHPYTSAHALQWVRLAKQLASDAAGYSFGIEHPDSGEIIGMIGLKDVDWTDRRAEVGYWLAKTMWRRGYMEEALGLAARFAFRDLRLHRLTALVLAPNVGSARLLEKVGFRYEGTRRKDCRLRRRWYDVAVYGLLAREWAGPPARRP